MPAAWSVWPYALALAAAGHAGEARTVAARPFPIRRNLLWLFNTGVRGLLAIAIDDRERAESAYRDLLPYAARPVGADSMIATLWPAAQILGDLAHHFRFGDAEAHYREALAVADKAHVDLWRQAAIRRLRLAPMLAKRIGRGAAAAGSGAVDRNALLEGSQNRYNTRSGRVRRQGLEPRTRGLRVRCSAN